MRNTRVTVAIDAVPKTLKAAIGGAKIEFPSEEPSSSISDFCTLPLTPVCRNLWFVHFLFDHCPWKHQAAMDGPQGEAGCVR
jgi:hypothetical protein